MVDLYDDDPHDEGEGILGDNDPHAEELSDNSQSSSMTMVWWLGFFI